MRTILLIAAVLVLSGCAQPVTQKNYMSAATDLKISEIFDETGFYKFYTCFGRNIIDGPKEIDKLWMQEAAISSVDITVGMSQKDIDRLLSGAIAKVFERYVQTATIDPETDTKECKKVRAFVKNWSFGDKIREKLAAK